MKFGSARERIGPLIEKLRTTYPQAHCELNFRNPFELLVATILSAQTTDSRVNVVTGQLFQKYPEAQALADSSQAELEERIKSTGFFRNKAKSLRSMAKDLLEKYSGKVPDTMDQLTGLAGVGRKTANVVLGNAFHIEEGVVVDTHVARLSHRLKLSRQLTPEKIEADLMRLVPRKDWTNFSHWLIWHGRRRCFARNPDCPHCELANLCPSCGKIDRKRTVTKPLGTV
jgi:endonuclease III